MSQQSFFNIQEVSSRTYNPDSSIIDTSLEHFGKQPNHTNNILAKSAKKSAYPSNEEIIKMQQEEIDRYKNALTVYINRIQEIEKGRLSDSSQDIQIKQLIVMINQRENEIADLKQKYTNAIMGLQQTVQKNSMLYREVEKYKKKHHDLQLNYSRDQNVFNKSQNLISNLSITKSNYEIELVNMKDSLVILQKENKKISETNEEYEEKLALLSQEIQRLRGVNEYSKQEVEKLKLEAKEQQEFIRKIQYQNHQVRQAIDRLRNQNQSLKNNNANISLQLHEYHQKIMYQETVINDLQQREARSTQTLKVKDSQVAQLQSKVEWYTKQVQRMQDEMNRRINQNMQQLGKVRITLNEKSNSQKKIEIEKEQVIREYNQLILRFESIKREHQSIIVQKDTAIKELQTLSQEKSQLIRQIDLRLNERQKILRQNESLKESLYKSQTNIKMTKEQKTKQQEATIRAFQQKQRNILREYQLKLQNLNEQKNSEINFRNNQINKLKNELSAKTSQINQFKSEISNKLNQIAQLKQSTMSQSTILDHTKRDCEEKIRERNQAYNELKLRLQNSEKLIEQTRRQRDMVLQQNKSLLLQMQKNEQQTEIKNSDLKSCNDRIETLTLHVRELQKQYEVSIVDVENYKRILGDNQSALNQYHNKLKEGQARIMALSNELQRITTILRQKENIIFQLNSQNRHLSQYFEQKKGQVVSLRDMNQKLSTNLSKSEQSKGNFQLFMKEIQRLNQIVSSKQNEIKNQRSQIGKIIQKIDILYQQQLKIMQIIQNTYADQSKRNLEINNEVVALKEVIELLNKNTSYTLQDLSKQSGSILNLLSNDIQNKTLSLRMNEQLSKKDQEIALLKKQLQNVNQRLSEKEQEQNKQQEIFQKLIELTQENAAIKEQLNYAKGQNEMEIQMKNQSIIELESKVNKFEKKQKQQIQEMKAYFNQKQLSYNESIKRLNNLKQSLASKNAEIQILITTKQKQIEVLKIDKINLQKKLDHLLVTINPRLSEPQKTNNLLNQNKNLQRDRHFQREVQKLEKILLIRNAQITSNEQGFLKLKSKLTEYQKQNIKSKNTIRQQKEMIQNISKQLKQSETSRNSNNHHFQIVTQLKSKNSELQKEIKSVQLKLSDSQNRLNQANQQITTLQQQLQKILQLNSKSINKIEYFESQEAEKQQLIQRTHDLQEQLEETVGRLRQIQINYDFIRSGQQQNKIHLHAYEYKTNELQKEYSKLKEVLVNLNNENSKLLTKNHFFEIQLKKAEILQQKIQVLNGEINRLSSQNINLSQQITSCKLALSGQCSLYKKSEQQLSLIVMLFAQIESLRNRLKQNELQLSYSHSQMLYKYRN